MSGESGQGGLGGRIADWFDRKPVEGPIMPKIVKLVGLVLLLATTPLALTLTDRGKPPNCAKHPLAPYVYKVERFKMLETCVTVTGTVVAWRHEHDDDYHVSMVMEPRHPGDVWINDLNIAHQHGYTVVEFVPRLPRPAHFRVGQRLKLTGTKVLDLQHGDHRTTGWIELHPPHEYEEIEPPSMPRPNEPKLAPPTEER